MRARPTFGPSTVTSTVETPAGATAQPWIRNGSSTGRCLEAATPKHGPRSSPAEGRDWIEPPRRTARPRAAADAGCSEATRQLCNREQETPRARCRRSRGGPAPTDPGEELIADDRVQPRVQRATESSSPTGSRNPTGRPTGPEDRQAARSADTARASAARATTDRTRPAPARGPTTWPGPRPTGRLAKTGPPQRGPIFVCHRVAALVDQPQGHRAGARPAVTAAELADQLPGGIRPTA